jgi:hypothetical protein
VIDAVRGERLREELRVLVVDHFVRLRGPDESRRRVAGHAIFGRHCAQKLRRRRVSQQPTDGSLVHVVVRGDDSLRQDEQVRLAAMPLHHVSAGRISRAVLGRQEGRQVSTCRRTHDGDSAWIDVLDTGIGAQPAHGALGISQRHWVAEWIDAVIQYEGCDTSFGKPARNVETVELLGTKGVTAPGQQQEGRSARRTFHRESDQIRHPGLELVDEPVTQEARIEVARDRVGIGAARCGSGPDRVHAGAIVSLVAVDICLAEQEPGSNAERGREQNRRERERLAESHPKRH